MTIRYLFILSALSALVFACRKNYYDYTSVEYSLNVIYPDTYATPNGISNRPKWFGTY
jgi:hypothetical protein